MESIYERDFLKIYDAFEKSTRGKWKMDLFSNRLRFNFKNRSSRITIPSIWKLLEGVVFDNGPGIFENLSELFELQVGLFCLFVGYTVWSRLTLRANQPRTYHVLTVSCLAANKEQMSVKTEILKSPFFFTNYVE